jgi:Ca2+-binding RTX toxin-like protein
MLRLFTHHGRRSSLPMIEGLEERKHLSATLKGGLLTVEGTKGNDVINVVRDKKKTQNVLVQINKKRTLAFKLRKINSILVNSGSGNDTVTLNEKRGALARATLNGGPGNDRLNSGKVNDRVDGGEGNDIIKDAGGNNTLIGGGGNDIIYGHNGDDHVDGGDGADQIAAKGGADFVEGGDGNDKLEGGEGDDWVYGDGGDDIVRGQGGADILGGDNEDVLNFWGEDAPAPLKGNDRLEGGDGDDWLLGSIESNRKPILDDDTPGKNRDLDNGIDTLIGGSGDDIIDRRGNDVAPDRNGSTDLGKSGPVGDIVPNEYYDNNEAFRDRNDTDYATHSHMYLRIFIDGEKVEIPIGLGEFGVSLIHKHTEREDGTGRDNHPDFIHLHTLDPHAFTLKELFHVMGVSFSSRNIGRYLADGNHTLTVRSKFLDEPQTAWRNVTNFGDHVIRSTDYRRGNRHDIVEVYYTTKGNKNNTSGNPAPALGGHDH